MKAFADERPREALFAQDVVLRINENNRSIFWVNLHSDFLFKFLGGCDRFKLTPPPNRSGSGCQFVFPEKFFDSARDFLPVGFEREVTRVQ